MNYRSIFIVLFLIPRMTAAAPSVMAELSGTVDHISRTKAGNPEIYFKTAAGETLESYAVFDQSQTMKVNALSPNAPITYACTSVGNVGTIASHNSGAGAFSESGVPVARWASGCVIADAAQRKQAKNERDAAQSRQMRCLNEGILLELAMEFRDKGFDPQRTLASTQQFGDAFPLARRKELINLAFFNERMLNIHPGGNGSAIISAYSENCLDGFKGYTPLQ